MAARDPLSTGACGTCAVLCDQGCHLSISSKDTEGQGYPAPALLHLCPVEMSPLPYLPLSTALTLSSVLQEELDVSEQLRSGQPLPGLWVSKIVS